MLIRYEDDTIYRAGTYLTRKLINILSFQLYKPKKL